MSFLTPQPKIAILILAAGASTRMGSPKQLLKWGESTLLNHRIEQAIKSKADNVFVVLGANYHKIKKTINQKSVHILKNDEWEMGMGNSVAFGVKQILTLDFNAVLIMLVDQPLVNKSYLNDLMEACVLTNKPIVATSYPKGVGVPAIFTNVYFNQLAAITGEKGAKELIKQHLENVTTITPKTPIDDIDTKEAYNQLYNNNL